MLVGLGSGRVCTYKYMCNCENIYLYTVYIYIRIDVLGIQSFWTVPSTKNTRNNNRHQLWLQDDAGPNPSWWMGT